jgi:DNA-binding MarR family transcriptional regulator
MPASRLSRVEGLDSALLSIRGLWRRAGIGAFLAERLDPRIEIEHYRALRAIEHEPASLSVGELAERLQVDASTSSRLVDRLVARGYVERVRDPEDRRRLIVRLLPSGKAVWQKLRDARVAGLEILTRDWPVADIAALSELLGRLDDAARKDLGGRAWARREASIDR